jgi:hypothetical protein
MGISPSSDLEYLTGIPSQLVTGLAHFSPLSHLIRSLSLAPDGPGYLDGTSQGHRQKELIWTQAQKCHAHLRACILEGTPPPAVSVKLVWKKDQYFKSLGKYVGKINTAYSSGDGGFLYHD